DPRLTRAAALGAQGFIGEAYTQLLSLLCEWPDSMSKIKILGVLTANRSRAGDLEAEAWFAETGFAIEEWQLAASRRVVEGLAGKRGEASKKQSDAARQLELGRAYYRLSLLNRAAAAYLRLDDEGKARKKAAEMQGILSGLKP